MWGPKTTIWKRKKNWMDLRVIDKHHLFNENIKGRLYNGKLKQLIYRTILHSHRGMLITKEQTTLSRGIGLPKTRFTLSLSLSLYPLFFLTHHSQSPPPLFIDIFSTLILSVVMFLAEVSKIPHFLILKQDFWECLYCSGCLIRI